MSAVAGARGAFAGLVIVGLGASLPAMDLAVNVAFPSVTAAFALQTQEIRWLVACYVLTYSSLMLAFGRLGDLIGHRPVFRAGLIVGLFAYSLCALAPDYPTLLASRIVQGVSTALLLSCAPALATLLFEEARRTWALGAYSSMAAVASVIAPLVGGAAIAVLDWSGVFWFRVPVAALALLLLRWLPAFQQPTHSPRRFASDLSGSALLAGCLASSLLSLTLLSDKAALSYALIFALAAGAGFAVFAIQQRKAEQPVLPFRLLRAREFALPNLTSVAVHFVVFAVPLLVPYYFARISAFTPLVSGIVLALLPAGILAGSAAAPLLVHRLDVGRCALLAGFVIAFGQLCVSYWHDSASLWIVALTLGVYGAGIGLFQVAYTDIVVAALPRRDRGVAGSLTMVTRTLGVVSAATAFTAGLGAVEQFHLARGMTPAAAFLEAFAAVFRYSALLLAGFLALSCLWGGVWFGRGPLPRR